MNRHALTFQSHDRRVLESDPRLLDPNGLLNHRPFMWYAMKYGAMMLPHQHASHQKYAQLQRPATYFVVWGLACITTISGRNAAHAHATFGRKDDLPLEPPFSIIIRRVTFDNQNNSWTWAFGMKDTLILAVGS